MNIAFFWTANDNKRITSVISALRTFILIGFTLAVAACQEEKQIEVQPRPVKTVVAQLSKPERILTYSGVVRPRIESAVGFRVSGKLVERLVDTGDHVAPDQVLARLDVADLQLSAAAQLANVDAAKTRLAVANAALARSDRLLRNGYVSKAAYDTAKLEVDSAQGALDAAEAQLRQNRNQVGYAELRANAAGVVTQVNAEPGQVVTSGQTILTIAESNEIEIAVAVPENELAALEAGMPARIALWADANIAATGKIREIAGAADSATRTYGVRIAVENPPKAMRLGMTANTELRISIQPEIHVPLAAITQQWEGNLVSKANVWVVNSNAQTVSLREVSLGVLSDNGVRIVDGLSEGEIVVAAGVQFLKEGQKVRLDEKTSEIANKS
ncbi:MAG: efflux RND transporter periplasmic adaptor subunit [Hyphomicrobiales bacterium]|nr:efflux RND transporter periplasmic adaptor subunit [Hyphomicrobiales bacterium]